MADSIDTRFRHLRSRTPEHSNHQLAPDQQPVDLEPVGLESAKLRVSRRSFLGGIGATSLIAGAASLANAAPLEEPTQEQTEAAGATTLTLRVNGKEYPLKNLDPRATLLDTLRERIMLEDLWQSGRAPWQVWT